MSSLAFSADVEAVLLPVDTVAPAGADLRYQPIFDEIKSARRLAEADPTELAPWKKVAELVLKATTRSKDIQLAIWLLEAFARTDGFRGASSGLVIVRRLLEQYWDTLYPQVDPDDVDPLGYRRALLHWIDDKLPLILKSVPLTGPPSFYGLVHYEVTQKTGDEKKALLDEGWASYERFEEAFRTTATAHFESVLEELVACGVELAALQGVVDQRFDAGAGSGRAPDRAEPLKFVTLKEAFETARWLVERTLKKRQPQEPPPAPGDQSSPGGERDGVAPLTSAVESVNGDQLWAEALNFTRSSRVDGLRLMQTQLATATSGRDRFLRQLQLAELSLEAGVYSLAFPVFDELARIVDARQLEEWEDKALIARALKGLARCCGLLKAQNAAAGAREVELLDRVARLDLAHRT